MTSRRWAIERNSGSGLRGLVPYQLREFHSFESAGERFVYLVPSGAIFALDQIGRAIVDELSLHPCSRQELVQNLARRGYRTAEIEISLTELEESEVISYGDHALSSSLAFQKPVSRCNALF